MSDLGEPLNKAWKHLPLGLLLNKAQISLEFRPYLIYLGKQLNLSLSYSCVRREE